MLRRVFAGLLVWVLVFGFASAFGEAPPSAAPGASSETFAPGASSETFAPGASSETPASESTAAALPAALASDAADPDDLPDAGRDRMVVGNPTAMTGKFFTDMFGGTTSDLDVQELLSGFSPVKYDIGTNRFLYDRSVVQDAIATEDTAGNRTYLIVFYDDLLYSDGTPVSAWDYAYSILLRMDGAVAEIGGTPADYGWILGAEEYLRGESRTLPGVRIIDEDMISITAKAESLPYFWELGRLRINPYPAHILTPGIAVRDDGDGVYLTEKLTAEKLRETLLDPEKGYLSHPTVVTGAYTLDAFDGTTAFFSINPYYKGNEEGYLPWIGRIEFTLAENGDMIEKLKAGEFGLLNKVTEAETIRQGIDLRTEDSDNFGAENYMRTGLTMIWFTEDSPLVQDARVRQAIAKCFDREKFVENYVGDYGMITDGFYGLGQWMYLQASGMPTGEEDDPDMDEETAEEQRELKAALEAAYAGITLDGITKYSLDTAGAARLLEAAGWKMNARGLRTKEIDGTETTLSLVLGMPESEEARAGLEQTLLRNLWDVGIDVRVQQMRMEEIEKAYRGESEGIDLLYLGEDFSLIFDPEVLRPAEYGGEPGTSAASGSGSGSAAASGSGSGSAGASAERSLSAAKAEIYAMALDMVRTEPADGAAFLRKWVAMQERISELLPLIPVYNNVYFDFFNRELHNYRITEDISWADAIVKSYLGDAEMIPLEEEEE